jgi:glycosyltransferase involved in cell wall biosynthesis
MMISCVHQGFELYGSDRSFIESVRAIRQAFPAADIEVVLPRDGEIVEWLRPYATRIVFEPLWILRRRSLLRLATIEAFRLPMALLRAWLRLRRSDIVYINTSVVLDYALVSRLQPAKSVLHIHEIPEGLALPILSRIVRWSRAEVIFNSRATRDTFAGLPGLRSHVIYNGVAAPLVTNPDPYDGSRPLRVLLLGRINRIKGQEVLLDAIVALPPALRDRVEVRMVGSSFETNELELKLKERVLAMGLQDRVSVLPFTQDPSGHYLWSDIVAVPSRRPESLGRVAIEAMAYGRPPVVSAIGGLGEVVDDNRTGWLVPPDDAAALSARLQQIILEPQQWLNFVSAGRQRYEQLFSDGAVAAAIGSLVAAKLARNSQAAVDRVETS